MTGRKRLLKSLLLVLIASVNSFGLDRDLTIDQLLHTAWTTKDGAPADIIAVAQTTDGYLWLGTAGGLFRFDAIRFEEYEPKFGTLRSRNISAAISTPDNGLWIGFRFGGVTFLKEDRATTYGEQQGFPQGTVREFAQTSDGAIWAATGGGLMRFENRRWSGIGSDWGYTAGYATSVYVDRDGGLWAGTLETLFYLGPHARTFRPVLSVKPGKPNARVIGLWGVGQTADGVMWAEDLNRGIFRLDDPREFPLPGSQDVFGIYLDRDGSTWLSSLASGISRISGPKISSNRAFRWFKESDGLTGNTANAILEDREGNIWVVTRKGLDRFSRRTVIPAPIPATDRVAYAMVFDDAGALWAANQAAGFDGKHSQTLFRYFNGRISTSSVIDSISCAYRGPDGTLWFGGQDSLIRYRDHRFAHVAMPSSINPRTLAEVQAITADGTDLWISVVRNGVFRMHDGKWTSNGGNSALPGMPAITLWTDSKGRLWFGYTGNEAAVLDGDRVRILSASDGLQEGNVTAIAGRDAHVWIGGELGLAYFEQNRIRMFASWSNSKIGGMTGIVETPNGDLWLNEGAGVVHITAGEIARALRDPQHLPARDLLDYHDGVMGTATPVRPVPSAILGEDGRIWLSGTEGIAWIDPKQMVHDALQPPVSIRSLTVNGRPFQLAAAVNLPPVPSNIEVDYTAMTLTMPERVRFRYQLEGFDKDWRDAGTSRSAFYNKLGPGRFRFHVIASNNEGVWNQTGADLAIIVPPAYFQTWWFRSAWAMLIGLLLWALYRARLRQVATQFNMRLEERVGERTRIARELHDNLLQSFHGLMLRFQLAQKMLPDRPVEAQNALRIAIDRAAGAITEGRDAVQALRSSVLANNELIPALKALGEEMSAIYADLETGQTPAEFRLVVEGAPEPLHPVLQDELFRIAREAVGNAFRHAGAKYVEVEVRFDGAALRLRVRDDGVGMESGVANGGRTGHWGLRGMRERAKNIGAGFELWSEAGAGTEIELIVPNTIAYRDRNTA
jgi:signal transduction histidine kinase/ligand-binding sensor domain-containing protein